MEERTNLEVLSEKVSQVLQKYNSLLEENQEMREVAASYEAQIEAKNQELQRLSDENAMKDLEIEDILSKIENILS